MTAIVTAALSAAAAFFGSWLAARFALDRFRSEKIWERRAAAYTAVFDALHDQAKWFGTHLHAMDHGREVPDHEKEKLTAEARASSALLKRKIDSETWLLSDAFLERIARFSDEMNIAHLQEDWRSSIEHGEDAVKTAIEDLRIIARRELRVPSDLLR